MLNIAVFASGRGSNFNALHNAINDQHIAARIVVVISNNSDSGALNLARAFQIPAIHLGQKQFPSNELFTAKLLETLESFKVGLIVLAGYMKKLDPLLIARFKNRIINVHPALLPAFGGHGMYGHFVHEAVIAAGVKKTGATVHCVDEEYDHGPIVLQESIDVSPHDSAESIAEKVLRIEHQLLPKAVALFAENKIQIRNGEVHIRP